MLAVDYGTVRWCDNELVVIVFPFHCMNDGVAGYADKMCRTIPNTALKHTRTNISTRSGKKLGDSLVQHEVCDNVYAMVSGAWVLSPCGFWMTSQTVCTKHLQV